MLYQDKIRTAFERHQISAEIICKIVPGLNPTALSRFMTRNVSLPVLPELMRTLSDLDALATDAPPYSLPFHDPTAVKKLINEYRNNGTRYIPVAIETK
jgi:hypothetical protein